MKIKASISLAESAVGRMKTAIGVGKISEAEDAISYMSAALSNLAQDWFPEHEEIADVPAPDGTESTAAPAGTEPADNVQPMVAPPEYQFIADEKAEKAEVSETPPTTR